METSPSIPESITAEFIQTFSEYEDKWWDCCNTTKEREKEEKKQRELKKKAEMFEKVKKPDVCNIIATTDDDRHPWYKDAHSVASTGRSDEVIYSVVSQKINKIQEEMAKKQNDIRDEYENRLRMEMEMRKKEKEEQLEKEKHAEIQQKFIHSTVLIANKLKEQNKKIDDYIKLFENSHGRKPLNDEISEALSAEIDAEILAKYLVNYSVDSIV
jgi:flagellar motor component MotA